MDKKIAMLCLCTLIAIFVIPSVIFAASFDCSKATTKTEKVICGDPTLSKLDEDMAVAYSKALKTSDPDVVKKGQRKWLKEVLAPCIEDKVCIKKAYENRLRQLESSALSEDQISPTRTAETIANGYSGKYIRKTNDNESAEIDIKKIGNGKYHITGLALWGNKNPGGPNIGELDFTALIEEAKIHYTKYKGMWKGKKEYYELDIIFNKNGLVAKEKNSWGFFGMNVYFEGEYIKK